MNFLRLVRLLVFRNIREEKILTFLSILGIALGVGLFMGVKVATDRAIASFETNIQGINPYTNYEIVNPSGIDFEEGVYQRVRQIEERSFPVLDVNAYLPALQETVRVSGIYTVKAARHLDDSPGKAAHLQDFFTTPNGILITKPLATRHDLSRGDTIRAYVYSREYSLRIIEVIESPALPSHSLLMDLGNFQELFQKTGVLTRVHLTTEERGAEEIRNVLPSHLTLESKAGLLKQKSALVASFRYNLQFITLLAVLVGVFLLYNTIFISVVKRRTEIGILRGLGTGKKTVVALFMIQGLILGLVGSVLGVLLGQLFAYFSTIAVEKTISTIYSTVSITDYMITSADAFKAVFLGLCVTILASSLPALESARVRPNESAREGTLETKYRGRQKIYSVLGFFSILLGAAAAYLDYTSFPFDFPYLAYAGVLLFILGCTLMAPSYLSFLLRISRGFLCRLFRPTAKMALNDIQGSLLRFSIALMTVAISAALIVALLSSIFSLKASFQDWLERYIIADLYIKPASCTSNYCFHPLADEVIRVVEGFTEVEDVGRFRALQAYFRGSPVIAGFGDSRIWRKYARDPGPDNQGKQKPQNPTPIKEISISDFLRIKYGLNLGDQIEIETPHGKETFTITYTSISYSTTSGFLYLDRKWLNELWGLDDTTQLSIYLKNGVDVDRFVDMLKKELLPAYSLDITNNHELRDKSLAIFDKSFALTYVIEVIAIAISLIGVINMLMILVFEKKREISILRYLGASWKQIRHMIVLSAAMVGMAGIILGLLMGPAISMVIIHVINKISFGWEVQLQIPALYLLILTGILFLTTLSAGLIPSRVARNIDPKAFISFE